MDELKKQRIITRQSQLKLVMDYLKTINLVLPLKEICNITEIMTNYVMEGKNNEIDILLIETDKFIKEQFNEE
jgi:hypothetical protein